MKSKRKIKNGSITVSPFANGVLNLVFILLSVVFLYPVLLIIMSSFASEQSLVNDGYRIIPTAWSLNGYKHALGGSDIYVAYRNTILASAIGTVSSVFIMMLYAYPLTRPNFKHAYKFTFFAYFTTLFGGGLVPWYMVCTKFLHINNTFFALFLPHLVSSSYIIILRTFIKNDIPNEMVEAAKVDGATEWRVFFGFVIPLSKPAIATIGLFMLLSFWNDYYLPMMLIQDEGLYNLQYYLQLIFLNIQMLAQNADAAASVDISQLPSETMRLAMCVLAMGPILIVYPFFQKYFISGLTMGSVKG